MALSYLSKLPGSEVFSLTDVVECRPNQVISMSIHRSGGDNITLFAFDAGEGISREILEEDCLYWVLEGEVVMHAGDESRAMRNGECFVVPARAPHAVDMISRTKLVVMAIG